MEAISLIITALVAGATAAAKETGGSIIKDAYQGLKSLIKSRFSENKKAQEILEEHEVDPETWDSPLRKYFTEKQLGSDEELIQYAKSLLEKVDPEGSSKGKYSLHVHGSVQGLVQGDNNEVRMDFSSHTKE